jgi:RNA polymerase sigma factor (sigma-70 family)
MAFADGNSADLVARQAFGEFYQRHAPWLYRRLCRTRPFGLLDSTEAAQDVVQETFYRAFKGADTFDAKRVADTGRLEGLVRGWLGGIANRVVADMLRRAEPNVVGSRQLEPRRTAWPDVNPQATPESRLVKALQGELSKLSPLQKDILASAQLYYQPESTYQRLPNGVARELARKHGTTPQNIRQVRRRTMAVLRKKLLPLLEED